MHFPLADGTRDERLCHELGEIKITVEICGKLTPKPLGWHPKIKTHQTYDLDRVHPLKVHSAKYQPLAVLNLTQIHPRTYQRFLTILR
jgi:hypothetical protein